MIKIFGIGNDLSRTYINSVGADLCVCLLKLFVIFAAVILLPVKGFSSDLPIKPVFDVADLGRPNMEIFTDKEGLPQNDILTITFDQKGYLWVGTDNGAAYYNGHRWVVVQVPTKSSKRVISILSTSDGALWFSTNDAVFRLKDKEWQEIKYAGGNDISGLKLYKFIEHDKVTILVASHKGLFQIKSEEIVAFPPFSNLRIAEVLITESIKGKLVFWISTFDRGLFCFEDGTPFVYDVNNGFPSNETGVKITKVMFLAQ